MYVVWSLYRNLWPSVRRIAQKQSSLTSKEQEETEADQWQVTRDVMHRRMRKETPFTDDTAAASVHETRIEISFASASVSNDGHQNTSDGVDSDHVLGLQTQLPVRAPETIRVRDLDTEHIQLFTPVTTPLTQTTQPHTCDTIGASSCPSALTDEEDFIPLSEFYDCDGQQNSEFGCDVLDPTEILCGRQLIGHGATSQVYRGRYHDEDVVLKFIVCSKEATFEKEFRRECTIFQKIPDHPNIIRMFGVVGSCLVLEYCNLGSLFDLIHSPEYPLPHSKVKELLHDIASSLHHIHSRRIIHRDLKPGNLLMSNCDGRDRVKLADFGLARNYLRNSTMTVGIGTWQYSSPEFFNNSKLTSKSDVFSFGVVMWEMYTRQQPYHQTHFKEIYECIRNGVNYALPVPDTMDTMMQSLYSQCVSTDPDSRPSFADILSVLENAVTE